jgi:hypothetical protein
VGESSTRGPESVGEQASGDVRKVGSFHKWQAIKSHFASKAHLQTE